MTDYSELKRLAAAIESCTSIPEEDEAAWMRRTTGRAVVELLEELENFKAEVPKWTEREITLISDKQRLEEQIEELRRDKSEPCDGCFMAESEVLRADAERFQFIAQDAESSLERIYGDDWLAVLDQLRGMGEKPSDG